MDHASHRTPARPLARIALLRKVALVAAFAASGWLVPVVSHAQPVRLVVQELEGPAGGRARAATIRALSGRESLEPVASDRVKDAARQASVDPRAPQGRKAVARELKIGAFIAGRVRRARGWRATIGVYDGRDGELIEEAEFRGRTLRRLLRGIARGLWKRLGPAIQQGAPPAPEEPEPEPDMSFSAPQEPAKPEKPEPTKPAASPEAEADTAATDGPSPFDAMLLFRAFGRSLDYHDDPSGNLRPYDLGLGPSLGGEAHWYPGAHFTDGVAANVGLELRVESAVGLSTETPRAGEALGTRAFQLGVGVRWRIPLGPHELGVLLGYGKHTFSIDPRQGADIGLVPDVDYNFIRMGADGRIEIVDRLAIGLRAAFLLVLSEGQVTSRDWFPNGSAKGIEAQADVRYALLPPFELRLGATWQRYFYDMGSTPEDAAMGRPVAGGAVDQYLSGFFAAAVVLE